MVFQNFRVTSYRRPFIKSSVYASPRNKRCPKLMSPRRASAAQTDFMPFFTQNFLILISIPCFYRPREFFSSDAIRLAFVLYVSPSIILAVCLEFASQKIYVLITRKLLPTPDTGRWKSCNFNATAPEVVTRHRRRRRRRRKRPGIRHGYRVVRAEGAPSNFQDIVTRSAGPLTGKSSTWRFFITANRQSVPWPCEWDVMARMI